MRRCLAHNCCYLPLLLHSISRSTTLRTSQRDGSTGVNHSSWEPPQPSSSHHTSSSSSAPSYVPHLHPRPETHAPFAPPEAINEAVLPSAEEIEAQLPSMQTLQKRMDETGSPLPPTEEEEDGDRHKEDDE